MRQRALSSHSISAALLTSKATSYYTASIFVIGGSYTAFRATTTGYVTVGAKLWKYLRKPWASRKTWRISSLLMPAAASEAYSMSAIPPSSSVTSETMNCSAPWSDNMEGWSAPMLKDKEKRRQPWPNGKTAKSKRQSHRASLLR